MSRNLSNLEKSKSIFHLMYVPRHFQSQDQAEILDFLRAHSFGILVSPTEKFPQASHLPCFMKEASDGKLTFYAHMARGNQHWKLFQKPAPALLIFTGPHAYISSRWYQEENVPTWNYIAVHLEGQVQVLSPEALDELLSEQMAQYEASAPQPLRYEDLSPELREKKKKGIVGLKFEVQQVQASFKLSQNRNERDYQEIVKNLQESPDTRALGKLMDHRQKKKPN